MVKFHGRPISIMVMYAIALHLVWAVIISVDQAALGATAVDALHRHIQSVPALIAVLVIAAFLAAIGLFTTTPWIVLLLIPQQVLLMMSASGAVEAIWLAQYADGVVRPRAFLAADQIYSVLAAVCHTIAIAAHATRVVK